MAETTAPLTVRVTAAMQNRIDRLAERMTRRAGGAHVSRHAALVAIVEHGLDALERKVEGNGEKRRRG